MTENTKKWLTVAGCLVVCAILVAVIASSFSKDKVTDDLLPPSSSQQGDVVVDPDSNWLGLYPLDWEFCFMPVQTYKNFITEQYHKNPAFYNISAGSIEKVLTHIDAILSAAMEDWNKTTNHAALRCPPMIFPLPKGQESNIAEFAVILKMDHDGDTVVYSPIPLPHLENQ